MLPIRRTYVLREGQEARFRSGNRPRGGCPDLVGIGGSADIPGPDQRFRRRVSGLSKHLAQSRIGRRFPSNSNSPVNPVAPDFMHAIQLMRALATLAFAAFAACASPPLPQSIAPESENVLHEPAPEVVLGPNDVLQVLIPGHPELANEHGYSISAAGAVILPLCGPVHVAGLGLEDAEVRIHEALGEYLRDPAVGVSVLQRAAHRVHLLGQLRSPGVFVLDQPTTALEALALAGGFEFGARRSQVAIIRRLREGGCDVYFFNGESPGPESMRWMHPGDVIFVPRSGVGVFRDEALPILQAIGFTTSQVTAVAIATRAF